MTKVDFRAPDSAPTRRLDAVSQDESLGLKHKSHDGRLFACASEDDPDACWYGCKPRKGVFTVMDCKPRSRSPTILWPSQHGGVHRRAAGVEGSKEIYESTKTPYETRQLLSAANSYDHVRVDDLFEKRDPKCRGAVVHTISGLPRNVAKAKGLLKTAVESHAWRPVSRAVYEVTARISSKGFPRTSFSSEHWQLTAFVLPRQPGMVS